MWNFGITYRILSTKASDGCIGAGSWVILLLMFRDHWHAISYDIVSDDGVSPARVENTKKSMFA